MPHRSSVLTWILGAAVVVMTVALTVQTAYLVWLHRQLSAAVLGSDGSLKELERLLATDVGIAAPKTGRGKEAEPYGIQDIEGIHKRAEQVVGQALADPELRDLLNDLGIEAPTSTAVPEPVDAAPFRPTFTFRETDDRYVVTVVLPGVKDADAHAVVENGTLKVSGTRGSVRFSESFAFPGSVVPGSERIVYRDGRVTVTALKEGTRSSGRKG